MAIPPESEWHLLPKTRAGAKALGVMRYFTGRPCKFGHVVPYRTSSGGCPVCHRERLLRRRADDIREFTTEPYYNTRREHMQGLPSSSPEAKRARRQRYRIQRRAIKHLRVDRRPPNRQDKASRAELKVLEDAMRARGNHPDHVVPFLHPRLRGLHTIANIQELTPLQNRIKGKRILTVEQIQRELDTGIRTPEPTEAELKAMVDNGQAVWPDDVDEDYEHTSTPGKVDWSKYPQHLPRNA